MKTSFLKLAAVAAAIAGVAAPAASAKFPDYGRPGRPIVVRETVVRPLVVRPRGFAWGDAGIGAGAAIGVGLVFLGSARLVRRDGGGKLVLD